jgi:hypothetical protein
MVFGKPGLVGAVRRDIYHGERLGLIEAQR